MSIHPAAGAHRSEPRPRVVRRRVISVSRMVVAFLLASALLPALLLAAAAVDLSRTVRRGQPAALRLTAFGWCFLLVEMAGLLGLLGVWLGAGLGGTGRRRRLVEGTATLQKLWVGALFHAARVLLSLTWVVEGDGAARPGPLVVFIRHASLIDVLIPSVLVTIRHGLRLRFVLKRELLADPCLDIAGHRLRNHFVSRDGSDSDAEIAAVRDLARGIGLGEGVLIYPEGSRFTPARRARALERLAHGHPDLHARAQAFAHVLPPRLGGPLALLDGAPHTDALFIAHHGLDGFALLGDIWRGGLVGRTVRVRMWRVPRAAIPADREARIRWLYDQWQAVDDFVTAARGDGLRSPGPRPGDTRSAAPLPAAAGSGGSDAGH